MAKSRSAAKRHRQSEARRLHNRSIKSAVRTSVKKFLLLAREKKTDEAEAALKDMVKKLDTAAGKGIIKKNTASRKKSRMMRYFNTVKSGPAVQGAGSTGAARQASGTS